MNPANPGKMVDFISAPSVVEQFRDQFAPYGIDWKKPFNGTLFRLPLRTPNQASTSRLSARSLTDDESRDLLVALRKEANSLLLFLKYVETIEISIWPRDGASPTILFTSCISNTSKALRESRSMVGLRSPQSKFPTTGQAVDYTLQFTSFDEGQSAAVVESWVVCNQLGGSEASELANKDSNKHLSLIPWGGVAARFQTSAPDLPTRTGCAYCFLPLPIETGLPIMVNICT